MENYLRKVKLFQLKIYYIVGKVKSMFKDIDQVIIEDVFVGVNPASVIWLSRLSGGVIFSWVDYKYIKPKLYKATSARALAGVKGNSHKAEIQLFVIQKYKFACTALIKKYEKEIIKVKGIHDTTELAKQRRQLKTCIKNTKMVIDRKPLKKELASIESEVKKMNARRKYHLSKVSIRIENETGIGEDLADSILLGIAYSKDKPNL